MLAAGMISVAERGGQLAGTRFTPHSGHYRRLNAADADVEVLRLGRQAFRQHGIEIPDVCRAPLVAAELARRGHLVIPYVAGWIIDAEPAHSGTYPRTPARARNTSSSCSARRRRWTRPSCCGCLTMSCPATTSPQ